MTTPSDLIEAAARAAATANGEDFDTLPLGKAEWTKARGMFGGRFRDINEPTKADYREMGEAALRSLPIPLEQLAALASGEAWVAPWECPVEFGRLIVTRTNLDPHDTWDAARDEVRFADLNPSPEEGKR